MKKICTVTLIALALLTYYSVCCGQTPVSIKQKIEKANKQYIGWFNSGQVDSLITQYHVNACITGQGCGKESIQKYQRGEVGKYTFQALTTENVTLKDNIATESGSWKILLPNGVELSGKYSTEWQQVNNRWVILKETNLN